MKTIGHRFAFGALALLFTVGVAPIARAAPNPIEPAGPTSGREEALATELSGFASAGFLAAGGGRGAAIGSGFRLGVGHHFALGFDFGYGLLSTPRGSAVASTRMEDRWWLIPSMAFVVPARFGQRRAAFDLGVGFGLGTASGYKSWSEYAAHPFTADWEYQLEPTLRAHAIGSLEMSPTLEAFARADAAAQVLAHGAGPSVTDSTWMMFSLGIRFRLL